ncbi:hypothetical protein Pla175_27730 [Pirellulimonas nuda]|uniref:Uncharacterized protein n=1 Tax=Pirellulimonas nuda TaxID=2528009 RepID=A0A518DD53_9BACT|nr:hypothetical protein Pla175_27730 [Pirellulimonas nuda]
MRGGGARRATPPLVELDGGAPKNAPHIPHGLRYGGPRKPRLGTLRKPHANPRQPLPPTHGRGAGRPGRPDARPCSPANAGRRLWGGAGRPRRRGARGGHAGAEGLLNRTFLKVLRRGALLTQFGYELLAVLGHLDYLGQPKRRAELGLARWGMQEAQRAPSGGLNLHAPSRRLRPAAATPIAVHAPPAPERARLTDGAGPPAPLDEAPLRGGRPGLVGPSTCERRPPQGRRWPCKKLTPRPPRKWINRYFIRAPALLPRVAASNGCTHGSTDETTQATTDASADRPSTGRGRAGFRASLSVPGRGPAEAGRPPRRHATRRACRLRTFPAWCEDRTGSTGGRR